MMKFFKLVVAVALLATAVFSQSAMEVLKPELGKKLGMCEACGMDVFEKMLTRVEINAGDSIYHACGLGCAQTIIEKKFGGDETKLERVSVLDFTTLKLVRAEKALYVIGSVVAPARAMLPYLNFEKRSEAEKFVKLYGGKVLNYHEMKELVEKIREERGKMK